VGKETKKSKTDYKIIGFIIKLKKKIFLVIRNRLTYFILVFIGVFIILIIPIFSSSRVPPTYDYSFGLQTAQMQPTQIFCSKKTGSKKLEIKNYTERKTWETNLTEEQFIDRETNSTKSKSGGSFVAQVRNRTSFLGGVDVISPINFEKTDFQKPISTSTNLWSTVQKANRLLIKNNMFDNMYHNWKRLQLSPKMGIHINTTDLEIVKTNTKLSPSSSTQLCFYPRQQKIAWLGDTINKNVFQPGDHLCVSVQAQIKLSGFNNPKIGPLQFKDSGIEVKYSSKNRNNWVAFQLLVNEKFNSRQKTLGVKSVIFFNLNFNGKDRTICCFQNNETKKKPASIMTAQIFPDTNRSKSQKKETVLKPVVMLNFKLEKSISFQTDADKKPLAPFLRGGADN
jgi:hypothetical protein